MATQLGKGYIYSLSGVTFSTSAIASYVQPNLQGATATHNSERREIKSQAGKVVGLIFEDDNIEVQFDIAPEGSTITNAKKSAWVPSAGTAFSTSNFPVIQMGGFTDGLNTTGTDTQPFIYEGGAQWVGPIDDKWTLRMSLKRYVGITSGTAIT